MVHPVVGSQPSFVHGLLSLQDPNSPMQVPPTQTSALVQAFLSSHVPPRGAVLQPEAGSHWSCVHALPSSQATGVPGRQTPPAQESPFEQKEPSEHGSRFGAFLQPLRGSQESSVHGFWSLHARNAPWQVPEAQASFTVHGFRSLHDASLKVVRHKVVLREDKLLWKVELERGALKWQV